jgi:hypothetical protein
MDNETSDIAPHESRPVATSPDELYTVSVPAASEMFAEAGIPRTERAIQRFCKNGELKWAFVDTPYGRKYLISQSSITRLITQKQQVQKATPSDTGDTSRPSATGRDVSRQADTAQGNIQSLAKQSTASDRHDTERPVATERNADALLIETLRSENFDLKVDNAGKQNFIRQLATEREKLMHDVQQLNYNLGAAETRVAQLMAPKEREEEVSRPVATPIEEKEEAPQPVGEGTGLGAQAVPELEHAPQSRRSLWQRMFEG